MKTGLVWDERYMWYDTGTYANTFPNSVHLQPGSAVESAESKRRIMNLLELSGLAKSLHRIEPATITDKDLKIYHTSRYVEEVKTLSSGNGGNAGPMVYVPPNGFEIAALAVGGTKAAIDAVLTGTVQNAYALVRPPGHHAEKDFGMGLCVFSNAVVATKLAMKEHQLNRVVIFDWDAHHGNGAESAFYDSDEVLTISIHQGMVIPGIGMMSRQGEGKGEGYNINIPLPPGAGTGAYLAALDRVVLPAIRKFKPDFILIASGLDACASDPTARMMLDADAYREMTKKMMEVASEVCDGRLILTHEGGYDLTHVPFCGLAIFEQLSGIKTDIINPFASFKEQAEFRDPHQALLQAI